MNCIDNLDKCKASCCRIVSFIVNGYLSEAMSEWYNARGCKLKVLSRKSFRVEIPHKCPHLTKDGLCDLHGSGKKPYVCKALDEKTAKNGNYTITEGCIYGD